MRGDLKAANEMRRKHEKEVKLAVALTRSLRQLRVALKKVDRGKRRIFIRKRILGKIETALATVEDAFNQLRQITIEMYPDFDPKIIEKMMPLIMVMDIMGRMMPIMEVMSQLEAKRPVQPIRPITPRIPKLVHKKRPELKPLLDWSAVSDSIVLSPREQRVLELRFGKDGRPWTLKQMGIELNLSRERIRQIEAKALRKLGFSKRYTSFWVQEGVYQRGKGGGSDAHCG